MSPSSHLLPQFTEVFWSLNGGAKPFLYVLLRKASTPLIPQPRLSARPERPTSPHLAVRQSIQ